MSVVKFPTPPGPPLDPTMKHKQVISVQEMYCQGDNVPDQMVWDMCRYTRHNNEPCMECPRWEDYHGDQCQRGCFGMALEASRYAMAWIERMQHGGPYD